MSIRATITLEEEAALFLAEIAKDNRSRYINNLLLEERNRTLKETLLRANIEEAEDAAYQNELAVWDGVLSDGLAEKS